MTTVIYGRPVSIGVQKDTISQIKKVYGINYPFGGNRGFFSKQTGIALVRNNLRQLLTTERGERVMLSDFGANLKHFLFEPLDQKTFAGIRQEILSSIEKYAPGVTVTKLTVIPSDSVSYTGVSSIMISLLAEVKELDDQIVDLKVEIG